MRFSLLGPLHVEHERSDLTPTAPKLRTVLAMMLVSPNQVLSVQQFVDEVWGEDPPTSARNTLQSYIVHLRRRLEVDDATAIHSESWGYKLATDESLLDLATFRNHIAAAQRHRERGELPAAELQLTLALAQWKGPPLVNVPLGTTLQASQAYLEELWLCASEQRIELYIRTGRHHDVLGELTLLSRRFPMNENLRAQHILVLYRSGRRYKALAAYDSLRRLLVDELGLEPCPALQRLHHDVLNSGLHLEPNSMLNNVVPVRTAVPVAAMTEPDQFRTG